MDGTCDCGELEGEFCQRDSTVSRQLIGRLGSGGLFALLLMLALLVCLGVVAVLALSMYKRKLLLFKKNEAADNSSVSFSGNVISFSNPVLDQKNILAAVDSQPIEYNMSQLSQTPSSSSGGNTTTTFSNPVYELESSVGGTIDPVLSPVLTSNSTENDSGAQTPSTSSRFSNVTTRSAASSDSSSANVSPVKSTATADSFYSPTNSLTKHRPEPAFNIIAPRSEILPLPPPPQMPQRRTTPATTTDAVAEDKTQLVFDNVSDV